MDGTLIGYDDKPRREIIAVLLTLKGLGHRIVVWSGGGTDYATMWVHRLFLDDYVDEVREKKFMSNTDISLAFDDKDISFGFPVVIVDKKLLTETNK